MKKHWNVKVTRTAMRRSTSDPRAFACAVQAFKDLQYDESPVLRHDVMPIACVNGQVLRQKPSRPFFLLRYRNIVAIVREDCADGKRGTLLLLAVLERDEKTYNEAELRSLIEDVIAEYREKEKVLA